MTADRLILGVVPPMQRGRRFFWCLVLLAGPGLCAGCSAFKTAPGDVRDGDSASWGGMFHRPAKKRDSLFFNEKSWDIEQRLERQVPVPSL